MVHFRFFKVPVYIDVSFWIFLFLIMSSMGWQLESLLFVIVLTLSIFIHEYGHALAALFCGADPIIILQAFGSRAEFNKPVTDNQKILITLAGPLFQGLLVLITYILLQFNIFNDLLKLLLMMTMGINIIWFLLNLIPIAPLDGGWLVRYILEKKWGYKGYRISIVIGLVAAAVSIPCLYVYFRKCFFFFIVQLLISGFQYCKLWQKEQER